ncbi:E1 ubiquitin-activating protein [Paraconiothyrium brasiliense]|uniref:E1 ubiquitin-activating protein n=1 Tax=Paraconiothyrium brasiliense TaxID=300254 RepID=A0ABR3R0I3_9PLEO
MVFFNAPAAIASLLAFTFLSSTSAKLIAQPSPTTPARLDDFDRLKLALAKRQACANPCGWGDAFCCSSDQQCFTDANQIAKCTAGGASGGWIYSTFYYTAAETVTKASIWSTYVGANPTASSCAAADTCGSACCNSGEWCADADNSICKVIGGGSAGSPGVTASGINPSAPLRPTSSGVIIITATGSATATVPFTTPIPTGVNGTLVESNSGGGGLSGGAIAGIVIGVIAGIILLLLICFYCCAKAAFDGILAIFGLGKKRRHTHEETTYIEEHHSGAAAGGGRRWYGQAGSSRPSRPPKKDSGGLGKMLGIGAGVAGLAALMGMRKKNERKHYDDKSTTVTDSSYYYSDYTSTSEYTLCN